MKINKNYIQFWVTWFALFVLIFVFSVLVLLFFSQSANAQLQIRHSFFFSITYLAIDLFFSMNFCTIKKIPAIYYKIIVTMYFSRVFFSPQVITWYHSVIYIIQTHTHTRTLTHKHTIYNNEHEMKYGHEIRVRNVSQGEKCK